jgi:hypothetical protein
MEEIMRWAPVFRVVVLVMIALLAFFCRIFSVLERNPLISG